MTMPDGALKRASSHMQARALRSLQTAAVDVARKPTSTTILLFHVVSTKEKLSKRTPGCIEGWPAHISAGRLHQKHLEALGMKKTKLSAW